MPPADPWSGQMTALGELIRRQRNLARLSLREVAQLASVSNAYLSQVERGLHQPSVRVLTAVAQALDLSAETLLAQAGLFVPPAPSPGSASDPGADGRRPTGRGPTTEDAIRSDPGLTEGQRAALLAVYHSYLAAPGTEPAQDEPAQDGPGS